MNRRTLYFLLVLAVVVLRGGTVFARDPGASFSAAPPIPVPRVVKVNRGEKIEIPLRIYGAPNSELEFVIRVKPERGSLTEPVARGHEVATVTYTPPGDLAITKDHFSYTVRTAGGVSAPADVQIVILDKPGQLRVPASAEFLSVLTGAIEKKPIEIGNDGGKVVEGDLEVKGPWQIEGSTKYRLAPGARQTFSLVFAPLQAGKFDSEIRYTSQNGLYTLLSGTADAALAVEPSKLELHNVSGASDRSGVLEVVNHTDQPALVSLSAGARLMVEKTLEIPAQGRATTAVEVAGTDVAELRDEIHITGSGLDLLIPVQAAATPALLQARTGNVHFSPMVAGNEATASVAVENIGGRAGAWNLAIAAPFEIGDSECRLTPGERREIPVHLRADAGSYRTWLKINGEQQNVEVPVEALVSAIGAPVPVRAVGTLRAVAPAAAVPVSAPAASAPLGPVAVRQMAAVSGQTSGLTVLPQVHTIEVQPTRAIVTWPTSISTARQFKIEERVLGADGKHLKIDWKEVRPAPKVKVEGDHVLAELRDLAPASLHAFRVSPMDGSGAVGEPLFQTQFSTPPAPPGFHLSLIQVFLLVIAVCVGLMIWRQFFRREVPS